MKTRNGAIGNLKLSSAVTRSCISGSTPVFHASVKTGSITNQVKNIAKLTIIMFGGACCTPIAWRKIDSTVTMNGKQVSIIASPGARLRTVSSTNSCTVRNDKESLPMSIERSCATAGSIQIARSTIVTRVGRNTRPMLKAYTPPERSATSVKRTPRCPASSVTSSSSPRATNLSPT